MHKVGTPPNPKRAATNIACPIFLPYTNGCVWSLQPHRRIKGHTQRGKGLIRPSPSHYSELGYEKQYRSDRRELELHEPQPYTPDLELINESCCMHASIAQVFSKKWSMRLKMTPSLASTPLKLLLEC